MTPDSDTTTGDVRCPKCGCVKTNTEPAMPGDYSGEVLERTCAGCGYLRGLIQ